MSESTSEVPKQESVAGKEHGPRHHGHQIETEVRREPKKAEARLFNSNVELTFEAARKIAQIVVPIAEAPREKSEEKLVFVLPLEIAAIKKTLVEVGLDPARLNHMPSFEIVALGDQLLRSAQKITGESKGLDEKLLVEKARDPDRAPLTFAEIKRLMEVEELEGSFGEEAKQGGPGAERVAEDEEREPVAPDIREIIAEMKILVREGRNVDTDARWVELSGQLQAAVDNFNSAVEAKRFLAVYEFVLALEDAEYIAEKDLTGDPEREKEILNAIITESQMSDFKKKLDDLDSEFQKMYDAMDSKQRKIILGDLENAVGIQLGGVLANWRTPESARAAIFGGVGEDEEGRHVRFAGIVDRGKTREKGLGLDGIREWRATKELYGVEEQVATELLTRKPARWEDVPEHIASIYQFLETSHFSIDELQIKINQSVQLLEAVPVTTEKSREMREKLVAELEAVRAFHSFRIAMERGDMNPEKVVGVFETYFTNETWKNFVDRFGRDVRQRQFVDKDGNTVNLFDEAQKLYFGKLQEERRRLNKIEDITGRELDFTTGDFDEKWLILRMALGSEGIKGIDPAQFDERIAALTDKQQQKVALWCRDEDFNNKLYCDTEAAINDWYEQNTLLGALTHLDDRRSEMREELRGRLIELGLKVKDGKGTETALEDELGQDESEIANFLRSVDFNAYNFSWTLAWSDFDGIRIYCRDGDPERIRAFAFNQSSHMFFGRHIDHVWEFFANERRGREAGEDEVMEIIRKMLPGKHHDLFPSNRTMVRFARFFIDEPQWKMIRARAEALMNQIDFKHPDPEYNGYFRTWAENVVMAEMIDSGELDFTAKSFSETASLMKKYEMSDLFYDRQYNLNYLKRENFQAYLADPSEGEFLRINDKETVFFSGRNFRQWPWMELAFRAHWEFESKHRQRLFDSPNLTASSGEKFIDGLVANGDMERKQAEHEKRILFGLNKVGALNFGEFFGTTPFRRLRQNLEAARRLAWESKHIPVVVPFVASVVGFWEAIIAWFKQLPKELSR